MWKEGRRRRKRMYAGGREGGGGREEEGGGGGGLLSCSPSPSSLLSHASLYLCCYCTLFYMLHAYAFYLPPPL